MDDQITTALLELAEARLVGRPVQLALFKAELRGGHSSSMFLSLTKLSLLAAVYGGSLPPGEELIKFIDEWADNYTDITPLPSIADEPKTPRDSLAIGEQIKPKARSAAQEEEVLRLVSEAGLVATDLEKSRPGTSGARARVYEIAKSQIPGQTFSTKKVFENAWDRLYKDGRLKFRE